MNTKKLKQLVLDLAIHGKLVPQDPNDEPASELLKRIVETHGRASKIGRASNKKSAISSDNLDDVPFEVPEGWVWTTIENAYIINPKNDSLDDTIAGFVPMSNVGDAFSNKFVYEERPWKMIKKGFTHFQNGDVAVAKISPCMENRKSVLFDNLPNGIGAGTTELNVFRSLIYPLYSLYFFKSEYFIARCTSTFLGTVGQQRVDKEVLLSMFIPLPPLSEQKRIVSEIEKWFGIIDQLESNEADLRKSIEQTKKKVLDLAIHGKLVPQDPDDEPASVIIKTINPKADIMLENEEYGEVPEGWCLTYLKNISVIARGGSPRPIKQYLTSDKDGINWIKIGDAEEGGKYIERTSEKITKDGAKRSRYVKEGDFLLTNSMSFGKPYILKTSGCIHDGWLVISPNKNTYDKDFLYFLLSSSYAYNRFSDKASGAVVSNLNKDKVADSVFPLPPLSEQKRIVRKIEEVFGELDRIEEMIG